MFFWKNAVKRIKIVIFARCHVTANNFTRARIVKLILKALIFERLRHQFGEFFRPFIVQMKIVKRCVAPVKRFVVMGNSEFIFTVEPLIDRANHSKFFF
jgi:hypothetical protein